MKRANGEGTIKKRKNGTWEGQFVAGRDEKGKLIRRSVYGKTQAEVSKKLTTLTNDLNTGIYISPDDITVGQWFDIWLSDYLGSVKQSTAAQYRYQIEQNPTRSALEPLENQGVFVIEKRFVPQPHRNQLLKETGTP